ncbi:hypothetical protein HPP92_009424 [Vanilla planifolia]|uniref:Uncharacterized protein n=1 Tax=Vanilla planifolia TaxID=51239 RepID=A0A835V4P5_VANPL|nr:hypothetical protein HPP92_009424 [Vanilla planifolia]
MPTPMFVPTNAPSKPSWNPSNASICGLKYTSPQYKPVHAGIPAGYGNYPCPVGFAVDEIAAAMEASEMWQRPREVVGLHPSPYDLNQLAAGPQAAYLPASHSGLGGAHPFLHYPSGSYNSSLPGSIGFISRPGHADSTFGSVDLPSALNLSYRK